MQPLDQHDDPLTSIERHLIAIEHMIESQNIAIAQLRDELADAKRRNEWHHVQFSEMIRILVRDVREIHATLICSVVNDGPISAQTIQELLHEDEQVRELEVAGLR